MGGPSRLLLVWATPAAWAALVAVAARADRLEPWVGAAAAAVVLLAAGLGRTVAGGRGGLLGRAGELVLLGGSLGVLLAEPAALRDLLALGVALLAGALTLAGAWPQPRHRAAALAAITGASVSAVLVLGLVGAPAAPVKAVALMAAVTATAWLLALIVPPTVAVLATLALAAAIGACHVAAWVLPPLVALALWALSAGRPGVVVATAVVCAALPPAGLAPAAGLLLAAVRTARTPWPLLAALPAAALAWWRLPADVALAHFPDPAVLALALPLGLGALPLLLPLLVFGLAAKPAGRADARDVLGAGLLVLPIVGGGPWTAAAAAALWLAALPALTARPDLGRLLAVIGPWTVASSLLLVLLAPVGGAAALPAAGPWLAVGWAVAVAFSWSGRRWARLAWLLPIAGLVWTVPVEGVDRRLAAGETLELAAPRGDGWVFLARLADASADPPADAPLLIAGDSTIPPLRAGRDVPVEGQPSNHPLLETGGGGRMATATLRGVARRRLVGPTLWRANADLVVRTEDSAQWVARRRRVGALLAGALVLLVLAHAVPSRAERVLAVGTTILLGATLAAGSGGALLALAGCRLVADFAAAVWLAAVPTLLGDWRRRRRCVAGALLLAPLALAQPLLRPPAGDEVYHLLLLRSLADDADVSIADDIDPARPEEVIYRPHGDELIHSPVLAVAALPAYLVLGHAGASLVAALLVALGAACAARRAAALGASPRAVELAWGLCLLTYPAVTFGTALWPAAAGIALVGVGLAAAARPAPVMGALGAAAALLVKVRLGLVTVPLALAAALGRRRLGLPILAGSLALALLAVATVLGEPLGRHRLVELLPSRPTQALLALWGLAWDGAGGLAFAAPLWLVAAAFLPAVWRRGGSGERALIAGAAATVLALLPRGEWYGGGSPPARYLAPLLPLVLLALAQAVGRPHGRRWVRLALPWAAVAAWVAVTRPLAWFNSVDGGWWLPDHMAASLGGAARELLPTLLRPSPAAIVVPLLLVTVGAVWTRRARAGTAALTLLGVATLAAVTATAREPRLQLEDPQVRHLAGAAQPPPGSFHRAAHGLSWRLPPGGVVEAPWRPPLARELVLRLRLDGRDGSAGRLLAAWDGAPTTATELSGGGWREVALPRPLRFGRGTLRLEWQALPGRPTADLLLDRAGEAP